MSDTPAESRRLSGVLLADVTGFSRLMGQDEPGAIAAVARIRAVFAKTLPRHGGTLEVSVGDAFVALFGSAVDAVEAAIAIQRELAGSGGDQPVQIRIGVHLGDVVKRGDEVFGDSVNIAARLQTLAQPGGLAISGDVYRAVRSRVAVDFRDLGTKRLKNIHEPVHVYGLDLGHARSEGDAPGGVQRTWALLAAGAGALLAIVVILNRDGRQLLSPQPVSLPAAARVAAAPDAPRIVGVTGVSARGQVPDWMREVTRDGLNTILSKVHSLRVYSRQKIDFVREKRGLSEIEAAEDLGIEKMIAGVVTMDGADVVIEVQVVDTKSGILDASERVHGKATALIELQNQLAANLLDAMQVAISPDERRDLFAKRTNDTLDGYRMLADTFGPATADAAPSPPPDTAPTIPDTGDTSWFGPSRVWAADAPVPNAAIQAVIEGYRAALQAKDLAGLAALHLDLNEAQRASMEKYFENADGLVVTIADLDVLVEGDEALATFTRRDAFRDHRSGKDLQLEVRLSSVLVHVGDTWKIKGVKKS